MTPIIYTFLISLILFTGAWLGRVDEGCQDCPEDESCMPECEHHEWRVG